MKSSNKATESSYKVLKNEIEETFGKKISSSGDCLLLSEEVYSKISFKVNSNTLRRFFGLVKSNHSPSATTLDILSKYCGFASFDEVITLKRSPYKAGNQDYYSASILNYLVALFRDTPVKEYEDKTFTCVVKHTILFLRHHPELIDKFQRAISKTRNGQKFYYEHFIDFDGLNSFYGDGLRYYLAEKTSPEALIFGHSLFCLKNWLSEDPIGVKKHYDEVMKHQLTKDTHPSLCAHFFATQLLYADNYKLPIEKILIKAQQSHASIKQKKEGYRFFQYFEYIISPVLLWTGHPEQALYYINYTFNNYPHGRLAIVKQGFNQTMNLHRALALVKTGRKKEAVKLYQQIHPSKFYFLTRKLNTIQYIYLSRYLNKTNIRSDQQLEDLIKHTGFIKLHQIIIAEE